MPRVDALFVTWTIVMRSLRTLDSVLILANLGYGAQALALGRTLIEDVVTAWWTKEQDVRRLLELLIAHEQAVAARMQAAGTPEHDVLRSLAGVPDPSRDQFPTLLNSGVDDRLARRHWTKKTTRQMANAVQRSMRPRTAERLEELLGRSYLLANLVTHNSPTALRTAVTGVHEEGAISLGRGPSTELVHDALAVAFDATSLLVDLVVTDEAELEQIDQRIDDDRLLFVVLPRGTRPERNDACPCGSGRKFKRCHGRD